MQQLKHCYELPHRKTFSRSIISSIYEEVKQPVIDLVQQEKYKVALTTDMQTSEANDVYLGLSCYFLIVNFELVSLCLAVEPFFLGDIQEQILLSCLKQILLDCGIHQSAVSAIIADNVSNMDL